MNNRQRKKWLKKQHKQVTSAESYDKDCYNLDMTIAKFVLPRLRYFREHSEDYPGKLEPYVGWSEDHPTGTEPYDEWMEILDKMILAFQYVIEQFDWKLDEEFDFSKDPEKNKAEEKRRLDVIYEGLHLFADWCLALWW